MDARLVFLGSLHIVIGAASLTLTVVTTSVIFTNKDLFKWISYKIMFQLNLCYLFHITAHIGVGFSILTDTDIKSLSAQVLGALLDIGWFGILFFNFLLSLERLNVTICKTYVKINKVAFVIISVLAWSPGVIFCGIDLSPFTDFYFDYEACIWTLSGPLKSILMNFSQSLTFTILPLTFFAYLLIYLHLAKKKTAYSDSQSQQERGNVEQCILMPSTLMFSYALAAKAVFFILRRTEHTSFWINFASLIVWMSEPLFCQVVQVVFNRSVRKHLLVIVGKLRGKKSSVVKVARI